MNETLKTRLIALSWHATSMASVVFLTAILDPKVLTGLGAPQLVVVISGLILAQLTKYLNQN
jgi:hypothetical protein